jgi:pimeloyl-ACP methyl ester carboxylesterase
MGTRGQAGASAAVELDEAAPADDLALLGPTAAPGTAERVALPRLSRRTITLPDGHQVGVAVCGEGVPLVMVHGFIAEGILYAQTLWRLVDMGFKVVAIDTAGHGGTQGLPSGGGTMSSYAQLLGRVLDELGLRKVVLAGHSMGGRLATELAATQPERVAALLLIDAIVGETWDRMVFAFRVWPPLFAAVGAVLLADTLSTVPLFRDPGQAVKLGNLVRPTIVGHMRRPWRLYGPAWSIMRSRGTAWMLDELRLRRLPTFVIHGARDLPVPIATARDTARRVRGELVVVDGAAHSWLLRDPEAMPAIVHQLMRGRLGTAVLKAKLDAGLDVDATPAEVDACPGFYALDSLAVALTPPQRWHDDETLHRAPRYRWHVERREW